MRSCTRAILALTISVSLAAPAMAQARPSPWMPSIGGGRTEWDVNGIDPSITIVMRSSRDLLLGMVGFEWGAAYAAFDEQDRLDPTQTLAFDTQLQVHTPWERVQPFAGIGPSLFIFGTNSSGRDKFELAANVGVGLRVQVLRGMALVLDVRGRAWDLFDDTLTTGTDTRINESREITLSLGFRR